MYSPDVLVIFYNNYFQCGRELCLFLNNKFTHISLLPHCTFYWRGNKRRGLVVLQYIQCGINVAQKRVGWQYCRETCTAAIRMILTQMILKVSKRVECSNVGKNCCHVYFLSECHYLFIVNCF